MRSPSGIERTSTCACSESKPRDGQAVHHSTPSAALRDSRSFSPGRKPTPRRRWSARRCNSRSARCRSPRRRSASGSTGATPCRRGSARSAASPARTPAARPSWRVAQCLRPVEMLGRAGLCLSHRAAHRLEAPCHILERLDGARVMVRFHLERHRPSVATRGGNTGGTRCATLLARLHQHERLRRREFPRLALGGEANASLTLQATQPF